MKKLLFFLLLSLSAFAQKIPQSIGFINGRTCHSCILKMNKEELSNAVIASGFTDNKIAPFPVTKFSVELPSKQFIYIIGNKFDNKAIDIISKLKPGSSIRISDIRIKLPPNLTQVHILPLEIIIID